MAESNGGVEWRAMSVELQFTFIFSYIFSPYTCTSRKVSVNVIIIILLSFFRINVQYIPPNNTQLYIRPYDRHQLCCMCCNIYNDRGEPAQLFMSIKQCVIQFVGKSFYHNLNHNFYRHLYENDIYKFAYLCICKTYISKIYGMLLV